MRRLPAFAVLFCFSLPTANFAQQPATSAAKMLAPESLLTLRHLSSLEFSPDGSRVALVVAEPATGDQRSSHIWLFDTSHSSFRQLTYSAKSESSPKWSPDGKSLAFLSNRDADQQIYLLSMTGGDAAPLTKGKRSISHFAWSHDGKQIAFLAPNAKTDAEEKKEKDKDDAKAVDRDDKHSRLWILNLADHSERALTPENFNVADLAWFPDGCSLTVIATDHPESDRDTERIFQIHTAASDTKSAMKQLSAPSGPFSNLDVAPSGHAISFVRPPEHGPSPHH